MDSNQDYFKARVKKPVKLSHGIVAFDEDRLRFGQLELPKEATGLDKYLLVPVWKYEIEFSEIKTVKLNGATQTFRGQLRDGSGLEFRLRSHQGDLSKSFHLANQAEAVLKRMRGAAIEGGDSFRPVSDEE